MQESKSRLSSPVGIVGGRTFEVSVLESDDPPEHTEEEPRDQEAGGEDNECDLPAGLNQ